MYVHVYTGRHESIRLCVYIYICDVLRGEYVPVFPANTSSQPPRHLGAHTYQQEEVYIHHTSTGRERDSRKEKKKERGRQRWRKRKREDVEKRREEEEKEQQVSRNEREILSRNGDGYKSACNHPMPSFVL